MSAFLPTSWWPDPSLLFPADPSVFRGPRLARWFTGAGLVLITARSLVHLLLPDGGAGTIATIDTSVEGGRNIIAIFGQWGAIQLLLALTLWALFLRYPGFVPLILVAFLLEPVLRGISGSLKPIETLRTAPGAALNWAVVPVVLAGLGLALCPADDAGSGQGK
jgi:hypothetical protein